MYKKLSEEKQQAILQAGISEFAEKGYDNARISNIAGRAGVSVGVIYKYYQDKDALFLACVRLSLSPLNEVLAEAGRKGQDLEESIRFVIQALIRHAGKHREVIRMYHEITALSSGRFSRELSKEIESVSSKVYTEMIKKAQKDGRCRRDADPRFLAFFFDNLLMMLQFSCSCDYYRERLECYCGEEALDEKIMADQLSGFLSGALGLLPKAES